MQDNTNDRTISFVALCSALLVAVMLSVVIATGVSQEAFAFGRLPDDVAARLLANPSALRAVIGIDSIFIVLYASFFALLLARLRTILPAAHLAAALTLIVVAIVLDMLENHNLLMMLHAAERDLPVSTAQTQAQMVVCSIKFHANYAAMALLAFGFARLGGVGTMIAWGVWLIYVPLGVALFVAPADLLRPLALGRAVFFVVALAATSVLFLSRTRGRD